jgi:hypothetical protein
VQQNWRDLTYLLRGTATQRAAYHALEALQIFPLLRAFDPVLAGTIPLDIDIPGSDLDIVCYAKDVNTFAQCLHDTFGHCAGFVLRRETFDGLPTVIGSFTFQGFPIEIFGQPCPVARQAAFRHLVVEGRLLRYGGKGIQQKIRQLKSQGLKTEPAFAVAFGLAGNPYHALLRLEELSEEQLKTVLTQDFRT